MKSKTSLKSKVQFPPFDGELMTFGKEANLQKYDDKVDDALSTSSFLPRLQLMTGNSEKCKNQEFPINKYALIAGQTYTDVGESVDILCLVWRPKAIDTGAEEMIVSYTVTEPEFKRIQEDADKPDSGCMYGHEFLVYIPSVKKFATFFMGTKTSRREAPNLKALLQKAATLKPGKIKTKRYTYFSPSVTKCSTKFELPSQESALEEIQKFNDPTVEKVERVEEAVGKQARG